MNPSISVSFTPTQTIILFAKKCIFKILCQKYLNHVNTFCLNEKYYCCDMKHNAKNKVVEERIYFTYTFTVLFIKKRSQNRKSNRK